MRKTFIAIFTCIIVAVLTNITCAASTGTVNTETARMRSAADSSASIVTLISMGEEVQIDGEEAEWYKVTYNGQTGYVSKSLLDVEGTQSSETPEETAENTQNTAPENQVSEETNTDTNEQTPATTEASDVSLTEAYIGNLNAEVTIKIMPSINSADIAKIEAGTQITVVEILNDWCRIESSTYIGWARVSLVQNSLSETAKTENTTETTEEAAPEESATNKVGYVNVDSVNVRKETSTSSEVVDSLTKNTEVTILGEESNWYKIQAGTVTGYIATQYISDEKVPETTSRAADTARTIQEKKQETTPAAAPTTPSAGNSATGASVVAFAKQYLGSKYVSGGSSPSTGFDCSGFTYYVYKNFGITLSRSSGGQASNGTSVSKANLQLGDLVIFNDGANKKVGHVGIYIGGNSFIHAANGNKGVIITSLSDSYYTQRFVDARRVL